jgi:CubicO group peptidase (beta-lactamase class C family)
MTSQEPSFLSRGISRRRALRLGLQGAALCASPAMPAICPPDPGPAGQSAVEKAIEAALAAPDSNIPSISYALISCGKLFAANAYGTAKPPNVAASSSTLYQAASISKTLAAVGGLYAAQANTKGCTLDSDVTPFLKWQLPGGGKQTNDNPVTLRRLLGMTAGANVPGYPGYAQTCTSSVNCQVPALPQILNGWPGSPAVKIDTRPGTRWIYSGGGYEIAESLVGDLMGLAYGALVQAKVLVQLNMTSSTWGACRCRTLSRAQRPGPICRLRRRSRLNGMPIRSLPQRAYGRRRPISRSCSSKSARRSAITGRSYRRRAQSPCCLRSTSANTASAGRSETSASLRAYSS